MRGIPHIFLASESLDRSAHVRCRGNWNRPSPRERMNTGTERFNVVLVASFALDFRDVRGVWEILDVRVAVPATKNSMGTGGVFGGINRDILALVRFHPCGSVTG